MAQGLALELSLLKLMRKRVALARIAFKGRRITSPGLRFRGLKKGEPMANTIATRTVSVIEERACVTGRVVFDYPLSHVDSAIF